MRSLYTEQKHQTYDKRWYIVGILDVLIILDLLTVQEHARVILSLPD